ncbi:cache domain-containing sensor histidine kinase [Paenibacillus sp. strain BS8-2]
MLRVQEWWNSVFFRFSAAFILVGLIPLITLSLFSMQSFTNHTQQYTVKHLSQLIKYTSYNVDNALNQYREISKLMYYNFNNDTFGGSVEAAYGENPIERSQQVPIQDLLKTVLRSDPYIKSAYFVRHSDGMLFYESLIGTAFYESRLPIDAWMDMFVEDETKLAISLPHKMDYFQNEGRMVLTFGRTWFDISAPISPERKAIGALFFDVDIRVFEDLLSELKLTLQEEDELYVTDRESNVYYSNNPERLGTLYEKPLTTDQHSIMFNETLASLNGSINLNISKVGLYEHLMTMRSAVFVAMIVCICIMLVMGIWFSRHLSSPIKMVIRQMMIVESGNLEVRIDSYGKDEIGRLARGFNRMAERLNLFIREAYVAELGRKQAELNALKSQIRPHYLYNTLEVIRMNAVHNDDPEVADMIYSLSSQLKYVINYGEDWVPLQRELEHLQHYFHIIKVSYEDRIELLVEVTDLQQFECQVLKLILQPVVENAVQHGLRPKGGKGSIQVKLNESEEGLQITITDDGVGMNEQRLQELRSMIMYGKDKDCGVGIKNVHERIRTVCGEPYGLTINSVEHIGTEVVLLLPVKKGDGSDDHYDHISG